MYPLPDHIPTTQEIFDTAAGVAAYHQIDLVTAIALLIAESGINFLQMERWNAWTGDAVRAIHERDWDALQVVVNRVKNLNSDDISFGPAHQAYRWSPEYDNPAHPTYRYDLNKIMSMRKKYIEDPSYSLDVAYRQLKAKLNRWPDPLEALCRYNSPNTASVNNPNRGNYANALKLAPQRIAELSSQPEEPEMPETYEFQFGFKALADELGADVVGEPLTHETYHNPDVSMQFTTTGMMVYSKVANKSYFFAAAH